MERFERNVLLIGNIKQNILKNSSILLVGVGGVGGFCLEALVRSGIGRIDIVDKDVISVSNINRQIVALTSTVGLNKVDVAYSRAKDINPDIVINKYCMFYTSNNCDQFNYNDYDYIIDCIDTITSKIILIEKAKQYNVPIISAMGCGNKLDPTKFVISDINQTKICPLARKMRYELKKRNIQNVKVLYSTETPLQLTNKEVDDVTNKVTPGSISYVPSVAGLIIASQVINDLIK